MSKAVSVRNSAGSNEKFSSKKREENGCSLKASDEQKGTLSMTRLQLHPDPNMDTDNRLGKLEPESPQSPGAESQMSFNVYDAKISGRDSFLGALPSSASTIGFWSGHHSKGKMDNFTVRAYSKRIRQLTLFLAVFIIVSMVMTALFVWRMSYYKLEDKTDEKRHLEQKPIVAPRSACPVRAEAVPLEPLPISIEEALIEIERALKEANTKDDTIAIMANVVYMDKVIWERSYGKMNRSSPSAPNLSSKTVFPVASVTKVFTALMLYKLYYEKKVKSLDDPFKKYMPKFSIKDPFNSHEIVLREMVSHMSGIPREAPCLKEMKENLCPENNTVMLDRIKNLTLVAEPGNKVSYSNLGFGLLGQGLALSQNVSYEEWMQKSVFDPLGMHDSGFKLTPKLRQRIPVGFLGKDSLQPFEWGWANPAGGMFTSLEDLAKLEITLFNSTEEDDFLSPVLTEEFFSPAFILDGKQFIGSPWEMFLMNGYIARMKNGFVYGYSSNIFLFPELKLAFNIFNTGSCKGCCFPSVKRLLIAFHEELTARDVKQQKTIQQQEAAPYLGEFFTDDVPTIRRVIIRYNEGKMTFAVDNHVFRLNHIKGTTFELIDRRKVDCLMIALMGINHERVHFDPPGSSPDGVSTGFTVFGFHLRGKAYFRRKQL